MGKTLLVVASVAGLVACASESSQPFTACKLGELTGTWRARYVEVNGDCGPIPDETAVFSPGRQDPAAASCTFLTNTISADKCRADLDWRCPPAKGSGIVRWTGVLRHTGESTLSADLSLYVNADVGVCRSTYAITMIRL